MSTLAAQEGHQQRLITAQLLHLHTACRSVPNNDATPTPTKDRAHANSTDDQAREKGLNNNQNKLNVQKTTWLI